MAHQFIARIDADAIRPALEAGHREFGENRVQEAQGKWPGLRRDFPNMLLHLIGPLQSNKTKDAVAQRGFVNLIKLRDRVSQHIG